MTDQSNEIKQVRLHVGGLPGKISEKDIEERFRSFGTVQKVDLIPHPFEEGACRGFAYVNLETSDTQLSKCMNVLNGCAWKGGKLHISFAKANKLRTLEDGRIIVIKNEKEEEKKKVVKKKRKLVRHASDFSLVTDKNVDKRKGWRRGRYGRAIACLRIRRPNRQILVIDPSHYKNNLEKLFGSVKPKPLKQLCWTITDIQDENETCIVDNDNEIYEEEKEEDDDNVKDDVNNNFEDINMYVEACDSIPEPQDVEVVIEVEPEQENVIESEVKSVEMDTEPVVEDPLIVNTVEAQVKQPIETQVKQPIEEQRSTSASAVPAVKSETKFEVNVSWSSLFAPSANSDTSSGDKKSCESNSGFSLNSLIEKSSKIKNVSMDELFKKAETPAATAVNIKAEEPMQSPGSSEPVKKVHNFAHLFGDLNRITPTTATRFGMLLSRKEEMLQEWRIERVELKEDFKKRLAEGKRRNRRGNSNGNNNNYNNSNGNKNINIV